MQNNKRDQQMLAEAYALIYENFDESGHLSGWKEEIYSAVSQIVENAARAPNFRAFFNSFGQPQYLEDAFKTAREQSRPEGTNLQNWGNALFNNCEGVIVYIADLNKSPGYNRFKGGGLSDPMNGAEQHFNEIKKMVPDEQSIDTVMNNFKLELLSLGRSTQPARG